MEKSGGVSATPPRSFHLLFVLLLAACCSGLYLFGEELLSRRAPSSAAHFRGLYRGLQAASGSDGAGAIMAVEQGAVVGVGGGGGSALGTRGDPDPLHIVFTLCGNPNEVEKDHYGLLSLKSILMAKEHNPGSFRHYVFHLVVNIGEEELYNVTYLNWEVYRAMVREARAGLISFHTYHIRELDRATRAALGGADPNMAVPHHIFKNCAATRIKLPFLLGGKVDRVLYLDWDTVAMCDLTRLWDHWGRFGTQQILGFASADPSGASERDVYRVWDMLRHPTLGAINSGVMLMDIGKMYAGGTFALALEFWRAVSAVIRSKVNVTGTPQDYWDLTRAFVLGDQDILNAMFAENGKRNVTWGHPEWLYIIPPQYNWCIDPVFPELLQELGRTPAEGYTRRPAPCIHHFCGNRIMSNDLGKEYLPVTDPTQATFMYIKHWELERREKPPGMREV